MNYIYILDVDGKPLMPSTRWKHFKRLLKEGKVKKINSKPYTIQLLYKTKTHVVEPMILGMDPGRTNIGITVVREDGKPVLSEKVETRNKEIPKLMTVRKGFRGQHRKHRREKKQRRAIKNHTMVKNGSIDRILPQCEKPIHCKVIHNKEARFHNRKRLKGWLTPTANQLLNTHIHLIEKVCNILPITKIVIEINKFAFMALDNPNVFKWQYQCGPLKDKGNVNQAVDIQQEYHCIFCKKKIDHHHHIVPRSKGGSGTIDNIVGVCEIHHYMVHTDEQWSDKLKNKKAGLNKKYGALSVLNQIIPFLIHQLEEKYPSMIYVTDGKSTKDFRDDHGIPKDHYLDAYVIASSVIPKKQYSIDNMIFEKTDVFEVRQFRRNDRQICHKEMTNRKYYKDGKIVATNRHRSLEQKSISLEEYIALGGKTDGLVVKPHPKQNKNLNRILPGAIMVYEEIEIKTNKILKHKYFVMQGSDGKHKGIPDYYVSTDGIKYNYKKCRLISENYGLVFL